MNRSIGPAVEGLIPELCRAHHQRARVLFHRLGLHRGQPGVLKVLWKEDGCTQSDLVAKLHVQPATVTNMLHRMEESGLVERRPDAHDHRVSRVFLTPAGREIESEVRAVMRRLDAEITQGFSDEECALLEGFLRRVRDNLRAPRGEANGEGACDH